MAKENPLNAGLKKKQGRKKTDTDKSASAARREGTVLVAGHFSPDVQRGLRIIAAEESTTVQALLAEGINLVFARRSRPEIANSTNAAPPNPIPPIEQEVTA